MSDCDSDVSMHSMSRGISLTSVADSLAMFTKVDMKVDTDIGGSFSDVEDPKVLSPRPRELDKILNVSTCTPCCGFCGSLFGRGRCFGRLTVTFGVVQCGNVVTLVGF